MLKYFFTRLFSSMLLFFGVSFISFAVIHLAPGNPVEAKAAFNPKMTLEAKEKLTKLYGLDQPIWRQFWEWNKRVARLDFGRSFVDGRTVTEKIVAAAPVTLLINGLSLILILLAGIYLGVAAATRAGGVFDKAITFFVYAGFSLPTFWLSMLAMSFFGVTLRILPVAGLVSVFHDEMSAPEKFLDVAQHLVLPVLVSSITGLAGIAGFMKSRMREVLAQNYIRTARAAGIPEKIVIRQYALKNALLPVITILGLSLPGLLGGSVIFESLFSIPGMGRLFFESVFARDYPVIMGILFLGSVLTLVGNFLADVGYRLADPRVRLW